MPSTLTPAAPRPAVPHRAAARVLLALMLAGATIASAAEPARPTCKTPPGARFTFTLDRVPLFKAAQVVADITCKPLVVSEKAENVTLTIVTPQSGQYTADEVHALFVEALAQRGLEVRNQGDRLVVQERRR